MLLATLNLNMFPPELTSELVSSVVQGWYLDIAALAGPAAVRNLEVSVEAHLHVVPLVCDDLPGTLHIGREVLGIVRRLDGSTISVDHPSTAWPGKHNN